MVMTIKMMNSTFGVLQCGQRRQRWSSLATSSIDTFCDRRAKPPTPKIQFQQRKTVVIWVCFTANRTGELHKIDGALKKED
uniref:Uncharacterized protein n=1 Tax=Lepeophtheirus salmonis TaxID=72036 RepID=A0A0K2TFL6_LEPSM